MLSRRAWLTQVFGAAAALAVAPLVDLTDTTLGFWEQPPIKELLKWKIVFPDGTAWAFNARVVNEVITDDGTVSLDIRPEGPMEMCSIPAGTLVAYDDAVVDDALDAMADATPVAATGTTLLRDGVSIGDIVDVELPGLEASASPIDIMDFDEDVDFTLGGLRRCESITMKVNFTKES